MKYLEKSIYAQKWNLANVSLIIFLAVLPNLLGLINLDLFGFKIHFFQIGIFAAAILYGPVGGLFSGLVGSLYSAFLMNNPYILIGNAVLGLLFGLFLKKGVHIILSVIYAYFIQLVWLFFTDYYLVGLSLEFITKLAISLFISNIIWVLIAFYIIKKINFHNERALF